LRIEDTKAKHGRRHPPLPRSSRVGKRQIISIIFAVLANRR
jgi:hypothetical protein